MIVMENAECGTVDDIGVGPRAPHLAAFLADRPAISWLLVHSDMGGDAAPAQLTVAREDLA